MVVFQIIGKEDLDLNSEERDRLEEKLESHGLSDMIPISNMNKDKAIKDLLVAEVVITRVIAMDSIFKGLNCLGLGKILRSYPSIIAPIIFPSPDDVKVCPEDVKMKFQGYEQDCDTQERIQAKEWFWDFIGESAVLKGK